MPYGLLCDLHSVHSHTEMSKHSREWISERMKEFDKLNFDQQQLVRLIEDGKSVVLLGAGGTGKSVVVNFLKKYSVLEVDVIASTGVAAVNVGGMTVHTWAGLGIGKDPRPKLLAKLKEQYKIAMTQRKDPKDSFASYRIKHAETIIFDEISMIDNHMFCLFEWVMRQLRENDQPFGGVQCVFVGDFLQLPPVVRNVDVCGTCGAAAVQDKDTGMYSCSVKRDVQCLRRTWDGKMRYAFSDNLEYKNNPWNKLNPVFVELKKVMRQSDQTFIDILHAIREGRHTEEQIETLVRECGDDTIDTSDGILPTDLYCTNRRVDERNAEAYAALPSDTLEVAYHGVPSAICTDKTSTNYNKQVPNSLLLKMLLKHTPAPGIIRLRKGAQVMLIANMDVSSGLCNGARGVVIGFEKQFKPVPDTETGSITSPVLETDPNMVLPVVRFFLANGEHVEVTVTPHDWVASNSYESARYLQIPLKLAWAITIHKSQGMSIPKMRAHLDDAFSEGQVYVALSRATGMRGHLHIESLEAEKIKVSQTVLDWLEQQRAKATKRNAGTEAGSAPRRVKLSHGPDVFI